MEAAQLIAIIVSLMTTFMAIVFALLGTDKAAQEKARERRLAEHRMNARLLRFNL